MNFSQLYDVSVSLSPELAVWPGDPALEIREMSRITEGADANVTQLIIGAHTGTHMDAPRHFIDGSTGIDQMPLEALVGTAYVLDMTGLRDHIGAAELEKAGLPEGAERVLFKTRNSGIWATGSGQFHQDYIALAPDGAEWLVKRGVKLVGIDYLSIERFMPERYHTHYSLLGDRVVVVEGLDLSAVEPGEYTLFALPLKIKNGDGAPARVLLGR
jgi:arylformamidase